MSVSAPRDSSKVARRRRRGLTSDARAERGRSREDGEEEDEHRAAGLVDDRLEDRVDERDAEHAQRHGRDAAEQETEPADAAGLDDKERGDVGRHADRGDDDGRDKRVGLAGELEEVCARRGRRAEASGWGVAGEGKRGEKTRLTGRVRADEVLARQVLRDGGEDGDKRPAQVGPAQAVQVRGALGLERDTGVRGLVSGSCA